MKQYREERDVKKNTCLLLGVFIMLTIVKPISAVNCNESTFVETAITDGILSERLCDNMFFYEKSPRVRIGDEVVWIDDKNKEVKPIISDGKAMLPAAFLAKALKIEFCGDLNIGTYIDGEKSITLTVGKADCIINNQNNILSVAPFVAHEKLYVPVEDICAVFDKQFVKDDCGIFIAGETANSFDWNNKTDFEILNYAVRDVIYDSPTPEDVIALLREKNPDNRHPRLMLDSNKVNLLRKRVSSEEPYRSWMKGVIEDAEKYLKAEPLEYVLEDGGLRLLYTSRKALLYIENMAFAYQMTQNEQYARGAIEVMMRVCDDAYFSDWHPYHFLDTAEMAAAVAIGYDWCYDKMSEAEKSIARKAIVEKALKPVMEDYNEVPGRERTWYWSSKTEAAYPQNWIAVCFGGTAMAALAIGDEDLSEYNFTEAGNVIIEGMERVKDWQETYMPDGACSDGTGYWEFAMSYMVFGFDSMRTALGTDYGMMDSPAMERTFVWLSQMMGPDGAYNFDSNNSSFVDSPEFFWYGAKYNIDAFTNYRVKQQFDEQGAEFTYKDILWYEPTKESDVELACDFVTRGNVGMTTLRSGNEQTDTWMTLFGGYMNKSPSVTQYFDGSFVLDMLGTRWAMDLGAEWQTYVNTIPVYSYYRGRAEGHNTVIIDPDEGYDHNPNAYGKNEKFDSNALSAYTVYDFTEQLAYKGAKSWKRGTYIDRETGAVIIQDELSAEKKVKYYWFMHTEAEIVLSEDKKSATLTKNGRQIEARLISNDSSIEFCIMEAEPLETSPHPETQTENTGVQKLAVKKNDTLEVNMAVQFVPIIGGNPTNEKESYTSLTEWVLKTTSDYTKPEQNNEKTNVFLNKNIKVNIASRDLLRDYMIVDGSYGNYQSDKLDRYASADGAAVKPLQIEIDLGGLYTLESITLIERWLKAYNNNRNGVGCYDLAKIETGITSYGVTKYITAREISGDKIAQGRYDNQEVSTNIALNDAVADKVRITLDVSNKDLGYVQYEIWEIIGMGKPVGKKGTLAVSKIEFSKDGVLSEEAPENGKFAVKVYHNSITPVTVLIALFDENSKLLGCRPCKTEDEVSFDITENEKIANVKVFSWEAIESLKPAATIAVVQNR